MLNTNTNNNIRINGSDFIIPAENIEKAYESVAEEWMALKAAQRLPMSEGQIIILRARAVTAIELLEIVTGKTLYYHDGEQTIKVANVQKGYQE